MKDNSENRKTVLLVDDDSNILFIGKFALEEIGYSVFVAESSDKAIQVFKENWENICCVILDFSMPGMNGAECLDKLREICPAVTVVISTGYEFEDLPEQIEVAGFLKKPYTLEAIRDLVVEITGTKFTR